MTTQAWYKRGLIRKPGGAIIGKRGGVSANLTWKAIAAWKHAHAIAPIAAADERAEGQKAKKTMVA
jgi:hypothetical protein